jgi:hypothetical protein
MGSGVKKAQPKLVQKELITDNAERRSKGAWSYGEMTQPRSHFVKERLIFGRQWSKARCESRLILVPSLAVEAVRHSDRQPRATQARRSSMPAQVQVHHLGRRQTPPLLKPPQFQCFSGANHQEQTSLCISTMQLDDMPALDSGPTLDSCKILEMPSSSRIATSRCADPKLHRS